MKWEYEIISTSRDRMYPRALDGLGELGWELVSVTSIVDKSGNIITQAYLKRQITNS